MVGDWKARLVIVLYCSYVKRLIGGGWECFDQFPLTLCDDRTGGIHLHSNIIILSSVNSSMARNMDIVFKPECDTISLRLCVPFCTVPLKKKDVQVGSKNQADIGDEGLCVPDDFQGNNRRKEARVNKNFLVRSFCATHHVQVDK